MTSTAYLDTVVADFQKLDISKRVVLGVGIDGSVISDTALKVACRLVNAKRGDELVVLHVADSTKTYLPRHLEPAHLKVTVLDKARHLLKVDASTWACAEKKPGQTTCAALVNLAQQKKVDMLVLGSFGRKGEKMDVLGSVSDFSLRQSHASVCIVRTTSTEWISGAVLLYVTDGSHASNIAFCVLAEVLAQSGDSVVVAYVARDDEVAPDLKAYAEMLAKRKVKATTVVHTANRNNTVVDGILELANNLQADVLVMGISGYGQKKLGSVSEAVCLQARCTTIIVKDVMDVGCSKRLLSAGAATLQSQVSTTPASPRGVRAN